MKLFFRIWVDIGFMTIESYQEFFDYTMFPVFAADLETGNVIYRNLACEKYLTKLSGKHSLSALILAQDFQGSGAVRFTDSEPYHTAIAFEDGERTVFLFLSYLQYENGGCLASRLFRSMGLFLTDFLAALHVRQACRMRGEFLRGTDGELYAETIRGILHDMNMDSRSGEFLYPVISATFEKLKNAFADAGYCVYTQIDENFPKHLYTDMALSDILFVLGRLLYLQLKLSRNKTVRIGLSCDAAFSRHVFYVTAETDFGQFADDPNELKAWIPEFIPECKMDFLLLFQSALLSEDNLSVKVDRFGNMTFSYSFSFGSPENRYVRSIGVLDIRLLSAIDIMIGSLRKKLTGIGASC